MFRHCTVAHHRSRGTIFSSRASLTLTGDTENVDYRQINQKKWKKKWRGVRFPLLTLAPAAPDSPLAPSKPGWPYRTRDRPVSSQTWRKMTGLWRQTSYLASADLVWKTYSVSFDSRKSGGPGESTSSLYFKHIFIRNESIQFPSPKYEVSSKSSNQQTWGPAGPRSPAFPGLPPSPCRETSVSMSATCPRRRATVPPSGEVLCSAMRLI